MSTSTNNIESITKEAFKALLDELEKHPIGLDNCYTDSNTLRETIAWEVLSGKIEVNTTVINKHLLQYYSDDDIDEHVVISPKEGQGDDRNGSLFSILKKENEVWKLINDESVLDDWLNLDTLNAIVNSNEFKEFVDESKNLTPIKLVLDI